MMAKQQPQQSPNGDQGAPFQIPEAAPKVPEAKLPDPLNQIAASIPQFPGTGVLAAGSTVPVPTERPIFPTAEGDYDPDQSQRDRANQSDAVLTLRYPAYGRFTALGTNLLGDCAVLNEMGTRQPKKALVSRSPDKKWLYFMPTNAKGNKGVDISYYKGKARVNLFKPFDQLLNGRTVEKGFTESFALQITTEQVTILGVRGYALYFNVTLPLIEAVEERDEKPEESAGKTATTNRRQKKVSAEASEATATAESAGAETESEMEHSSALERINDEMLAERDEKIKELEKTIRALEKKLGKLDE